MYKVNRSFLPPIYPDESEVDKYYNDRSARFIDPGNDELMLPDIKNVDVQFLTNDYSTVTMFANNEGDNDYVTFPNGMRSLKLPEIRELNVKLRKTDGTVINFHTQPQFYREF